MSSGLKIGVLGAEGRMGGAIIHALDAEPAAQLAVALSAAGSDNQGKDIGLVSGLSPCGVSITSDIRAGLAACDVMIDFSSPQAAIDAALSMHSTRCRALVTGTTGYTETEEKALIKAGDDIALVKSGNFSLGVNMLEALTEIAAARLRSGWDIEILDMHHNKKIDAPSGTALMLGDAAARGRGVPLKDVQTLSRGGRGEARSEGEIGFAALRGGGVIGQHDVRIASDLEMITLRHEAFDRQVFAQGAVVAALWAADQPKGHYSMKDVLGL